MKLNSIFSDNMILQANKPVYIFGSGKGSATFTIGDKSVSVVSETERWITSLEPFSYGGPYEMTAIIDGVTTIFKDIYFGDVYLIAGQSNNAFKLRATNTPKDYYKDNDSIRLYTVDRLEDQGVHTLTKDGWKSFFADGREACMDGEHYRSKDGWIKAREDEVGFWSAVGYLTAYELSRRNDRKIGIVACYQGASVIQSWLPQHYLDNTELYIEPENRSGSYKVQMFKLWNEDGKLYEGMLEKILPFAIKSVVWYQGESNTGGYDSNPHMYAGLLKTLIEKWRVDFKDKELPFVIVQIHNYVNDSAYKNGGWQNVQASQEEVCKTTDNAYLVKSADICETDDIHPVTKLPLSLRIADALETIEVK